MSAPAAERISARGLERSIYKDSLYEYLKDAWLHIESAPFVDSWHIGALTEHLQAVTRGQIPNLLINIPPGCSKSLTTCVMWPTWEWSTDAAIRWFFASYDQKLSTRDSVKCRSLITSRWYQGVWPNKVELKHDQDQKTYYETTAGGYRLATSIGGHGTGEHPDRIVVDDPHNVRKSESETDRQNVIDWWDLTMPTRGLSRNARRVVIMQRLHPRDLSGHIMTTNDYVHICLPMRYEPKRMIMTPLGWNDPRTEEGKLLTPDQFNEEMVAKVEKSLGPYGTAGQLQQRPQPRGGGMFRETYFHRRARCAPYDAVRVRFWDRASTQDGGCYSAGVLMAKGSDGTLYVEDVVHGQWEPNERNDRMVATAKRDRARYGPKHEPMIYVERERGSTGLESFQRLAARLQGYRIREDAPTGAKDVRAEPWSDQLAAGNVVIVDGGQSEGTGTASWDVDNYITEHVQFKPTAGKRLGKYKDQVDASSAAAARLADMKAVGSLRVVTFGNAKKGRPRLVICNAEELVTLDIEQPALLIILQDPGIEEPTTPEHSLRDLKDTTRIDFADLNPADCQATWNTPLAPYNKLPQDLIMNRDHGRKLWSFLLKQRTTPPEVMVFCDLSSQRRADSIAKATADILRLPRPELYYAGYAATETDPNADKDHPGKKPPDNPHVYDMTKVCRESVMG